MKPGPVTKLNKENTITSKQLVDDAILAHCDVILTFWSYGQFGAIRKTNSRHMICIT